MYDLFGTESIDGNNHACTATPSSMASSPRPRRRPTPTPGTQLFNQAEDLLLNQDVATVPINWYVGDLAWNPDALDGFSQTVIGLVPWEQITVLGCH